MCIHACFYTLIVCMCAYLPLSLYMYILFKLVCPYMHRDIEALDHSSPKEVEALTH